MGIWIWNALLKRFGNGLQSHQRAPLSQVMSQVIPRPAFAAEEHQVPPKPPLEYAVQFLRGAAKKDCQANSSNMQDYENRDLNILGTHGIRVVGLNPRKPVHITPEKVTEFLLKLILQHNFTKEVILECVTAFPNYNVKPGQPEMNAAMRLMLYAWEQHGGETGLSMDEYMRNAAKYYKTTVGKDEWLGLRVNEELSCRAFKSKYFSTISLYRVFDRNLGRHISIFWEGTIPIVNGEVVVADQASPVTFTGFGSNTFWVRIP